MNNRDYKEFSQGEIYHVYNRGNNKEKIFFEEQDYKSFLFRLGLSLGFNETELQKNALLAMPYSRIRIQNNLKNGFKLHAFCLMSNHFHLILEQTSEFPVSDLISKVCTSYSKYVNNKYNRVGHVFQDQFKAVPITSNEQLMWTSAYIHMNPVKDKLASSPENYVWSSYLDHIMKRDLKIVCLELITSLFGGKKKFEKETFVLSKMPFDS